MRVGMLVMSGLLCMTLVGCSTKKKLDDTLDNANNTIDNANKRINELAKLADDLKSDLSDAAKMTSNAASNTLSGIKIPEGIGGGSGGGGGRSSIVPSGNGTPRGVDEQVDLDEDGKIDPVTVVEYDSEMLWLVESTDLNAQAARENWVCSVLLYFVSDKPPENLLSWGFYTDGCGTLYCPPEQLEDPEDFSPCACFDDSGAQVECQDFFAVIGGQSGGGGNGGGNNGSDEEWLLCEDELGEVPESAVCDGYIDCNDGSDEAYCGGGF